MLFIGESRWNSFFIHFGFLRYRLGRSCIYLVAGIMTLIIGRTYNTQCDCKDFTLLQVEGACCLLAGLFQLFGIFLFGASSAPSPLTRAMDRMHGDIPPPPLPYTKQHRSSPKTQTLSYQSEPAHDLKEVKVYENAPPPQETYDAPKSQDINNPSWMNN